MTPKAAVRLPVIALAMAASLVIAACSSGATATLEPAPSATAAATTAPTSTPEPTPAPDLGTAPESADVPEPPAPVLDSAVTGTPMIADGLTPLPSQPEGVAFPTVAWPEGTLPSAVDADALAALMTEAFEGEEFGIIEAAVVIDGGELVFESYGNDYRAEDPHVSWSVAKSVTHALLGVLTKNGQINVMAPAAIPAWQDPGDPRTELTPDMLARMSSGLQWNELADALAVALGSSSQPASSFQIDRELVSEPDATFNYSTGSTAVNGKLMADIIGTGEPFDQWAHEVLFDPLGIQSVQLEFDVDGNWIAGYGANMTARDFARFGLLYLRDGVWDGEQILPEGWVDYGRTPSVTTNGYGAGWWLDGEEFSAQGFRGQRVAVLPEHDMVIVVLANNLSGQPSSAFASRLTEIFTAE